MSGVIVTARAEGAEWELWQALMQGDADTVLLLVSDPRLPALHANVVFDTSDVEQWKEYRFNLRALRIWSLCYRQEFTSPLHICSSRGFQLCVQYLLSCGALPDLSPGGKTALHEACENAQGECVRLLLNGGANPNARSEDGYCPLHLCTAPESLQCAQYLLASGAAVDSRTEEREDSSLHFAARFGLELHVELYLGAGAAVNGVNGSGQTPLHCACAQPHGRADAERYHRVCRRLLDSGAAVRSLDSEQQSPLHLACSTANHRNVEMLLGRGADTNRMDYGGNAPLHNALQAVSYRLHMEPERTVRALLNHGSIRIWPGAMPKVLKYCSGSPRTIEVLANVYDRLKVTDDWIRAVSPEVLEEHAAFYGSMWALGRRPRSLQHLARCVIRTQCPGLTAARLARLPLPPPLIRYLLLPFRGELH